jgi:hypothetical protein
LALAAGALLRGGADLGTERESGRPGTAAAFFPAAATAASEVRFSCRDFLSF